MLSRLFFTLAALLPLAASTDAGLRILPREVSLSSTAARQRVLVERFEDGVAAGQVTEGVVFQSSDPKVVRIEEGTLVPVGNGSATVIGESGWANRRVPGCGQWSGAAACLEFSQSRAVGAVQEGLQFRGLPRGGGGEERI